MSAPKDRSREAREEFEIAYYTKELGKPLQRQMLRQRLADFSDSRRPAALHGEEEQPEQPSPAPQDDEGARRSG